MKIKLRNVGALSEVDIPINGITVIIGKNGTGKSTVLKALYCMAESSVNLDERVREESKLYLRELSRRLILSHGKYDSSIMDRLTADLEHNETSIESWDIKEIKKILENTKKLSDDRIFRMEREKIDLVDRYLNDPTNLDSFYLQFFKDNVRNVFKNQLKDLRNDHDAKVTLYDDSFKSDIIVSTDDTHSFSGNIPVEFSDVTYIDTPFVIDSVNEVPGYRFRGPSDRSRNHRESLAKKLSRGDESDDVFDRIITEEKKENLNEIIRKVVGGEFEMKRRGLRYTSSDYENLDVTNLATGMKTFSIIKLLLDNGHIDGNSLLLIDEPEIHLHPEWQLIMAEVLVLMSTVMGTRIVLTTHSPQFLLAIEAYSMQHDCKIDFFNFEKNESGTISASNVNDETNKLYESMAEAYNIANSIYDCIMDRSDD